MPGLQHIETAARKKIGAAEGWRWFKAEAVSGGWIITGCLPTEFFAKGPRKGRPKFKPPGDRVVVSESEVATEEHLYVLTTGNCPHCFGAKEEFERWTKGVGTTMRPCSKCEGTGKAKV